MSTHVLVDVEGRIRRSEDLGPGVIISYLVHAVLLGIQHSLVNVVDTDRLKNLRFDDVSDARLGHNLSFDGVSNDLDNEQEKQRRTGIETASIISLIIWGSLMRATPPSFLRSEGMR